MSWNFFHSVTKILEKSVKFSPTSNISWRYFWCFNWGLGILLLTCAGIMTAMQTLSGDEVFSSKSQDTGTVSRYSYSHTVSNYTDIDCLDWHNCVHNNWSNYFSRHTVILATDIHTYIHIHIPTGFSQR